MHSLGLPASKTKTIPQNVDPVLVVREWAETQVENWLMKGLSLDRLVLDPGVGFGKTPSQSLKLLREIDRLFELGVRVLVGHSRKSFMNLFTDIPFSERDLETLGASAKLASLGVDILRVHNVEAHIRSLRSFSLVE
jgi:dihydropteroate synthase